MSERPTYELPAPAARCLAVLESAGFEAWAVGGWVRDAMLGSGAHDVDLTCSARWERGAAALRAAGIEVHETGTAHGTITAVVSGEPVEITTYRVEGAYSDLRHPDSVRFVSDVREDLARRDFTINAMAWHPVRGLLDPFGGADDLAAGVIRCVGDPPSRFGEDALRVLRAVRFACRLGFLIEPATQDALVASASGLASIARERIGSELAGILATHRGGWALAHETEVMTAAIPELGRLRGFDQMSPYHVYDVLEHTAHVMNATEAFAGCVTPPGLAWAALLHDVAKPDCFTLDGTGRGHFFGHPRVGSEKAEQIMRRLALPLDVVRPACALIRLHDHMVRPDSRSIRRTLAKLDRAVPGRAEALAFELLVLKRADALSKAPGCDSYVSELGEVEEALRSELSAGPVYRMADLAISGADVLAAANVAPGPAVGRVLADALDAVLDGRLPNDRDVLLREVEAGRL
jgi:tRNA nucleotidyltransferase (CCA-adding enzyme)